MNRPSQNSWWQGASRMERSDIACPKDSPQGRAGRGQSGASSVTEKERSQRGFWPVLKSAHERSEQESIPKKIPICEKIFENRYNRRPAVSHSDAVCQCGRLFRSTSGLLPGSRRRIRHGLRIEFQIGVHLAADLRQIVAALFGDVDEAVLRRPVAPAGQVTGDEKHQRFAVV